MHGFTLPMAQAGLTLGDILRDIPHDPAAFFLYLMLLGAGWLIWKGSRGSGQAQPTSAEAGGEDLEDHP